MLKNKKKQVISNPGGSLGFRGQRLRPFPSKLDRLTSQLVLMQRYLCSVWLRRPPAGSASPLSGALHVSMQGVGRWRCHFICKSAPPTAAASLTNTLQPGNWSCWVAMVIRCGHHLSLSLSFSLCVALSFSSVGKLQCSGDRVKDAGIPPHKPQVVRSEVKVTLCVCVCVFLCGRTN